MTMASLDDIFQILQELRDEISQIRSLLHPKRCSEKDIEQLARLLPALAGKYGSENFTTTEGLMDPAIKAIAGSSQSAGLLLARALGDKAVIGGLAVESIGREHNRRLWKVVACLPDAIEDNCGHGRYSQKRKEFL
jgi:hypothetical protein